MAHKGEVELHSTLGAMIQTEKGTARARKAMQRTHAEAVDRMAKGPPTVWAPPRAKHSQRQAGRTTARGARWPARNAGTRTQEEVEALGRRQGQ